MRCREEKQGIDPELKRRIEDHPCYSEKAHHRYARIHLPVAPRCNIQCNYCNRKYDCQNESRPGVTSAVLAPEEALERVEEVSRVMPNLSVVGIAGPGDPLANPDETFRTFELLRDRFPDMKRCMSTNGLMLIEHADRIHELGIDHVTVTLNAVDPEIGARIYSHVILDGQRHFGREGASVLLERQLLGLRMLRERAILTKVNIVMVPGVNDDHIPVIARRVNDLGAFIINVIGLIPTPNTPFADLRGPTPSERKRVQDQCEGFIRQMRWCRQCRSDAIGLLGHDLSSSMFESGPVFGEGCRMKKDIISSKAASPDLAKGPGRIYVAVSTMGDEEVNSPFPGTGEVLIYEATRDHIMFLEARDPSRFTYGDGSDNMLKDVQAVIASDLDEEAKDMLAGLGIDAVACSGPIRSAVARYARGKGIDPPEDDVAGPI